MADAALVLLLALASLALVAVQAAGWPRAWQAAVALALLLALGCAGELASRTSAAELLRWAAQPQRRQDLAACVLAEALLFGTLAARSARHAGAPAADRLRWLDRVPPPSALLALFLGEVAAMLLVDGYGYETLAWAFAIAAPLLLAAASVVVRLALPHADARAPLRLLLHAAQVLAALWLARPAFPAAADAVALYPDRLAVLGGAALALVALGWLRQRWRRPARFTEDS